MVSVASGQSREAEWSPSILAFRQMSTPPLTAYCILIGQLQRKPSESCQKLIRTFIQVVTVGRVAL